MDNTLQNLTAFARDPENAELNYVLGIQYEQIKQTAAAISYFLRCAERTTDTNLTYECLCKIGLCFERQTGRNNTVRGLYKQAMCLLPKRPEAYFLLARFYERVQDHVSGVLYSTLALDLCDFNQIPLRSSVEYPGKYGLVFQKAVSLWWWGKPDESRETFQELKNTYSTVMDKTHFDSVQRNLSNLGCGKMCSYSKENYPLLRYKFIGAETIERNYSSIYQDMFVLSILNGKRNGTYLEIGSGDALLGNNTKLLEEWGWGGVGIELQQKLVETHTKHRKNIVLNQDATKVNYNTLCSQLSDSDSVIDYLQIDCEPSETTFNILKMIPFDQYFFRVITFEHDHYVDMTGTFRELSRQYLKSKGYMLVVNDVAATDYATTEDWWVHPSWVDEYSLMRMKQVTGVVNNAYRYIFQND